MRLLLHALRVLWTLPERCSARDKHPGQGERNRKERNVHLSVGNGVCEGCVGALLAHCQFDR